MYRPRMNKIHNSMTTRQLQQICYSFLVAALLFAPAALSAQSSKLLKKANALYSNKEYVPAEELYQQIVAADPQNRLATQRLGYIRLKFGDYEQALRWFQTAVRLDPNANDTLFMEMGDIYKRLNQFDNARKAYDDFMSRHRTEDAYYRRAEVEILGCDYAERAQAEKPLYAVRELMGINSQSRELSPAILDQRQASKYLVFTSFRKMPGKRNKTYSYIGEQSNADLLRAEFKDDTTLGRIDRFPKPINTELNEGAATFTSDGMVMYFAVTGKHKTGLGSEIYESRYNPVKKAWNKPVKVESLSAYRQQVVDNRGKSQKVPCFDTQPHLSHDGRYMFFVSDREGGQGGLDLWFARKQGNGWTPPQNLGNNINTPFDESTPAIDSAMAVLFFASKGHLGMGGSDLYRSDISLEEGEEFGVPTNLGAPLNSTTDENSPFLIHGDSVLYFATNRSGGSGSFDIYYAVKQDTTTIVEEVEEVVPEPVRPAQVSVAGLIRDKASKVAIPFATAILYRMQGETLVPLDTFKTDHTGRYSFPLELNQQYKVLGNAPEYFANEVEVSTVGIEKDEELERNIDIELERIIIDFPIVLQNVYYDFDEYYLRQDAIIELNNLVKIMVQNPNITIQLGSHTDTNGGDEYNRVLSDNRAKACVRYLVESGIAPARIAWKGYGESNPLIFPEVTDQDEQANRRTEFRVLSIDYVPRQ